jgi:hypothetical protein
VGWSQVRLVPLSVDFSEVTPETSWLFVTEGNTSSLARCTLVTA